MFDEFMRQDHMYLVDEVMQFVNLVSTIVRDKDNARIYLVANTVSWNSPYFKKFGLKNVSQMKPGELAVAERTTKRKAGDELTMRIAIEYCESTADYGGKPSDVLFVGIDDERMDMITGGSFAVPSYPPCPHHFTGKNVLMTCWVLGEVILRCRLINVDEEVFFFIDIIECYVKRPGDGVGVKEPDWERYKILREDEDLVYSLEFSSHRNHFTNPAMVYSNRRTRWFPDALRANRIFFESNEAGEELMYYLIQAQKRSITSL